MPDSQLHCTLSTTSRPAPSSHGRLTVDLATTPKYTAPSALKVNKIVTTIREWPPYDGSHYDDLHADNEFRSPVTYTGEISVDPPFCAVDLAWLTIQAAIKHPVHGPHARPTRRMPLAFSSDGRSITVSQDEPDEVDSWLQLLLAVFTANRFDGKLHAACTSHHEHWTLRVDRAGISVDA